MDRLDLRNADRVPVTGRHVDNLQGLLLAAGFGPQGLVDKRTGRPDCIAGPGTKGSLGAAQVKFNTGDGQGHADYVCGDATWRALIEY